ncbi:MAG: hypothetical protein QM755_13950 [Luteolibacter sp.]
MKRYVIALILFSIAVDLLYFSGLIRITYPKIVNNPVLSHPIQVTAVSGDQITLVDGRVLKVESMGPELTKAMSESRNEVELQPSPYEPGEYQIYGRKRRFICGTPWAGLINIPIIPCKIDGNERTLIGFADDVASSSAP